MAELQHYARLGKTFSVGWLGGWLGGWVVGSEKLKIRLKLSTAGAWAKLSLAKYLRKRPGSVPKINKK